MNIIYHVKVVSEDIPKLPVEMARRIKTAIENKLMSEPLRYGLYLQGSLKGYLKLRVGDYRIIYRVEKEKVLVLVIGQRKDNVVYNNASKRI